MKFTQMLDVNMVPEWRNQYLDYAGLESILQKAVESKNIKSREKGVDSYFELIKFNQKFATYFSRECQSQLDKINTFHREKLSEMKGKYNNLQDQLDQVLSSAIYREIQPDNQGLSPADDTSSIASGSVASITELFRTIRSRFGSRADIGSPNPSLSREPVSHLLNGPRLGHRQSRLGSISPILADKASAGYRAGREKMSMLARKFSESFTNSAQRFMQDSPSPPTISRFHNRPGLSQHPSTARIMAESSAATQDGPLQYSSNIDLQHLQNLSAASPQSKKKIIASYKRKMNHIKFAFRELYFNLVLFEQYTQLNHSGFEQVLRKHDRMFASTLGRKFYQEFVQTADFYNDLHSIDHLIEGVEHVYTLHFENGNRRKAIEKLQVPSSVYKPTSPILDFRVGYELGVFSILFILVLLVGFFSNTGYDWRTVFRLYRSPLIMIIFLFQSGISIVIWKHYKVNHVLIFELNPRNNLSFHHFFEFGSLLGIIWAVSIIIFLFSERIGVKPSICPLIVVFIIISYLFNPTATCHHRARFWLLKILGRIFTAPFHPVRFADFWIADQLVSIVPLFLDLEFLSCFYTTGDVLSKSHLSPEYAKRCVTRNPQDLFIRTIVAALPAWFRCAQCLRRWRDENWLRLHLANAAKYFSMVSVVFLSSISQFNSSPNFEFDTWRIVWMVAALFTSSLTAWWDVIYDFGLFGTFDSTSSDSSPNEAPRIKVSNADQNHLDFGLKMSKRRRDKYPFLRKELLYPVWVYYFAIVENWILRFGWIISISLTEFSGIEAGLVVSLLAPMEMFRRFVWNCIRLENEQLNNCGLFRAVRDIPMEVVAPIDESHLDKIVMMMDSRDGPSMRNRLMKRRTLRPDRVSFMVLQKPNNQSNLR